MNNRKLGSFGEECAYKYLLDKGFSLLRKNYRVGKLGEIDLIVKKDDAIHFIEVKARTCSLYGQPCEAVSYKKQKTIRQVAQCFLKAYNSDDFIINFDIIEVFINGLTYNINHIENAF